MSRGVAIIRNASLIFVLMFLLPCVASADMGADYRTLERAAFGAYKKHDMSRFLVEMQHAYDLRPDHPRLVYNLAIANALNGNKTKAIGLLGDLAAMGLTYDIASDSDFSSLKDDPKFAAITRQMAANGRPHGSAEKAFVIHRKGLVGEGLVYDSQTGDFYIGSVAGREIWRVSRGGDASVFAGKDGSLWSVFGLAVDSPRHRLLAATSTHPQMPGLKIGEDGKSAILAFNLDTGKLQRRWAIPGDGPHLVGDLTISPGGDIYATDSREPTIYRIAGGVGDVEVFLRDARFRSLQGLAVSDDGKSLFVADYPTGISRIDLETRKVITYTPPPRTTTVGIDGLYFVGGNLVGVQNGVNPQRIVRLTPSPELDSLVKVEVVAAAMPEFDDLTLGTMVGREFYFIADGQWRLLGRDGTLTHPEELRDLQVMKVRGF